MSEKFTLEELNELLPILMDGFTGHSGVYPVSIEEGRAVCGIKIEKHHLNPVNGVHGGCLYTLADVVGGLACRSAGYKCITTMTSSVNFMRAGLDCEKITGTGTVLKAGKNTITVDVEISDDKGSVLTKVISTYFVLDDSLMREK